MRKLLLIGSMILLTACSSESTDVLAPDVDVKKRLSSVYKDGKLNIKIEYDNDKVSSFTHYDDDGKLSNKFVIEYQNNKRVQDNFYNADNIKTSYIKYYYELPSYPDLVTKREVYMQASNNSYTSNGYQIFTNNTSVNANNITSASAFDEFGNLIEKTERTYTDANGSFVMKIYNSAGVQTGSETVIRDNKKSWSSFYDPFYYQNQHNTISSNAVNIPYNITWSVTNNYTYDAYNYPVSAFVNQSGITPFTYTFNWE